ncbi:hypothetical protein R9C00_07550 [Flammeovirgaceae bacterium SG7u.111]|nr:hypothetical protein [Flammeovirgaceae bacterium SG7u.132]WPO37301.1 hypothetical protein R9C00_07550 [Flammeovirgaceae bacterium SG7u.111]
MMESKEKNMQEEIEGRLQALLFFVKKHETFFIFTRSQYYFLRNRTKSILCQKPYIIFDKTLKTTEL